MVQDIDYHCCHNPLLFKSCKINKTAFKFPHLPTPDATSLGQYSPERSSCIINKQSGSLRYYNSV